LTPVAVSDSSFKPDGFSRTEAGSLAVSRIDPRAPSRTDAANPGTKQAQITGVLAPGPLVLT
jgi:hypothetical protein